MPSRVPAVRSRPVTTRAPKTTGRTLRAVTAGLRGEVHFNASLKEWTSFRIGGPADILAVPHDVDDLCRLLRQARASKIPLFVIGGTNVLIRDGGIRGIVVSLSKLKAIVDESDSVVYAEGGVTMPVLLQHSISRSLSGLEWAAGIPGTVAGCVVMNAGTRLGEMKDAVKAVRIVSLSGTLKDVPASAIPFSYRRARMPRGIVAGVWLQLTPGVKDKIQTIVKDYLRYRKDTQPLTLPNAGCAFKNPQPDAAGQLIEAAGLKGFRIGDAQVSEKHANFIVNRGDASADDVLELIAQVRRTVEEKTGVKLQLELKVVGEP
ncbi:MAG TPA: UDP-N-acetylmuramate dehydrogenase [Nitrospiraceae bacterium]|nr:UDP-N-acetylmuramate dehydrogenase [Nitrospiraceae bacterium]